MTPYYEADGITLYHGDCRELLPTLNLSKSTVLTGPPWFEDPPLSRQIIGSLMAPVVICQWYETAYPPCPLPLVAVHIWNHSNGTARRYQPFYHFAADGRWRESEVFHHPIIDSASDEYVGCPYQYPWTLAMWLLGKAPWASVCDPFAGSGTTLLAAQKMKRRAIGIEANESFCEMAAKRLCA